MTARPEKWWERPRTMGRQGSIVTEQGRPDVVIYCPKCGAAPVVYNGNYFCDNWNHPAGPGDCDWAMGSPARSARDRKISDRIGINYNP